MTGNIFNRVKEASSDRGLHLTHYKQHTHSNRNIIYANFISELPEPWSVESFGEEVGQLILCVDIYCVDHLGFLKIADEVKPDVDVFRTLVELGISHELDGALVVDKEFRGLFLRTPKVL